MMDFPQQDLPYRSANRKIRQLLGRSYLREERLVEALEVFLGLAADEPDDGTALLVIGNLYRVSGCLETAAHLYAQALALDPYNPLIERRAAEAAAGAKTLAARAGFTGPVEETDPLSAPAVRRLIQRLQDAAGPDRRAEIRASADMLEKFIPEGRLGGAADAVPDSVQQLMPALIEMNIRHARASGRSELAEALQSLQIHFRRQTGSLNPDVLNDQVGKT